MFFFSLTITTVNIVAIFTSRENRYWKTESTQWQKDTAAIVAVSLYFRMRRNQSIPKENPHLSHKRPKIPNCAILAVRWLLITTPCITCQIIHFFELHMINLPNVWVAKATIALCNRSGLSAWINSSWGGQRKKS